MNSSSHQSFTKSQEWLNRAQKVIPSVTQTLSKGPTQYVQGVSPVFIERGEGSHVWDVDGNEFIDYPGALGPNILGYAHRSTTKAVTDQLARGINHSLMHPLEVELAELLVEVVPCAEKVRFGKNGSDATTAAVRASRAYTGRDKVAICGYHGPQDWFIPISGRDKGVPKFNHDLALAFEYNNLNSLKKLFDENPGQIAAVILEPVTFVLPDPGFLQGVVDMARANGAVAIFDEVKTGFRISLGGAQEYFGVTPDLAAVGKALGNGMPISAVVGNQEIMNEFEEVFFSTTFGGETLSLAASIATINEIRENDVMEHLRTQGKKLQDSYNSSAAEHQLQNATSCEGLPGKSAIQFADFENQQGMIMKSLVQQSLTKQGILFNGEHMLSASHSDNDIDRTIQAYGNALATLANAVENDSVLDQLEGPPLEVIIRPR
jgi:glutamate-1-semialdehyde aminotransferase